MSKNNEEQKMDYTEMAGMLIGHGIATDEEILLVAMINGRTIKSMLQILYVRTGLESFEQLDDEDMY